MTNILNFDVIGKSNDQKVIIIAHGLFGSNKNWRTNAKSLAALGYQVVVVDMRNHGISFWDKQHSYFDLADDLKNVIAEFGDAADVIGHSMGGKAAMTLSLLYPKCIKKLVVVDIAPVSYKHNQLDFISAMESIDLKSVNSRKEVYNQLNSKINNSDICNFLCQSVELTDTCKKKWRLNLCALRQNMPAILGFPTVHARFFGPSIVIRGDLSIYVADSYLPIIEDFFPNFSLTTIKNADHWLHYKNSEEFDDILTRFLNK